VDHIGDIVRRLKIQNGAGSNLLMWGDWNEEPAPGQQPLTLFRL